MKEVNKHVKEVMGITPNKKVKKDYTKAIGWAILGIITVTIWSLIYYLFSY
jgi:molecular chaperone DnaK (HSP70)